MNKIKLVGAVLAIVVVGFGQQAMADDGGAQVLARAPIRLALQGYTIPSIPVTLSPGTMWAAGLHYYAYQGSLAHIELNGTYYRRINNKQRASVFMHELLHYYSENEYLVEAVAVDEVVKWYRVRHDAVWYVYERGVQMVRWKSQKASGHPWQSPEAMEVRKQWLLTSIRPFQDKPIYGASVKVR